jgi:hypothetical protein
MVSGAKVGQGEDDILHGKREGGRPNQAPEHAENLPDVPDICAHPAECRTSDGSVLLQQITRNRRPI